jgi:hypothetical protein
MVDDKCCGCCCRVQGPFPNMEGVAVLKKKFTIKSRKKYRMVDDKC